jgi:hypothetical protein
MDNEREKLLSKIRAYYKADNRYSWEQLLNDAFSKWNEICQIRSVEEKHEIALQVKYAESNAFHEAKDAAQRLESNYRFLVSECGAEGYEGIGYLIEYALSFAALRKDALEVPGPIVDLAGMDLDSIRSKKKPVL